MVVASEPIGKSDLYQTGSDTPMGRLLRQFWQPIALSSDVSVGSATSVRALGEDLTLYRGQSGKAHLVAGSCAHRCSSLKTGWVEGDDIRCMYHGWRYNGAGLCLEIPAEKKPRDKPIRIVSYPLHEYSGLLFAYMGEGETPAFELPRKEVFEDAERSNLEKREVWDCNWFQQVENSMDAVHLSFAHMWGIVGEFGEAVSGGGEIPELEYEETSSGMRQIATRSNGNVRISDWTFPNNNHIVAPGPTKQSGWGHVSVWAVPVDDFSTMRYRLFSIGSKDPDVIEKARRDQDFDPASNASRLFKGDLHGLPEQGVISAQDYVAVRGQGVIFDRDAENLSTSDAGIIFLRKMFFRELKAIRDGGHTRKWAKLTERVELKAPPSAAAE
jgi:5,5'-dehydrodivanillate O-demethylase